MHLLQHCVCECMCVCVLVVVVAVSCFTVKFIGAYKCLKIDVIVIFILTLFGLLRFFTPTSPPPPSSALLFSDFVSCLFWKLIFT